MRMQDGPVATADKAGQSHEAGETEDNECLSLRIRLPDGKVSLGNVIYPIHDCGKGGRYVHFPRISCQRTVKWKLMNKYDTRSPGSEKF